MNASDNLPDHRIDELETRLSFQDHLLGELNEALVSQNKRVARLEQQLVRALDDLGKLRGLLLADPGEEPPPPHY
ncbi:MAG: SlyX family protein [Lysobacteraceae bacterium]|nr:SlyX family protein [Xanthomonadales bacterium]HPF74865.1 SlyX family protein [Xanthomonadaceae bacterium]HRY01322.1 SlyX family protein [Xanthomonadaceae bacterium]